MASLEIVAGMNAGQMYEIDDREVFVGRDSTCHVVLPYRTVSRAHCRILKLADGYYVEDLQSVNGTLVNGKKIDRRTPLANKDRIRIHDIVLAFLDADESRDSTITLRTPGLAIQPLQGGGGVTLALAPPPLPKVTHHHEEESRIVSTLDARTGTELRWEINAQLKLKAVLEITRNLGSTLDTDAVLPRILDSLFRIFPQTDRGYILQSDRVNTELVPKAIKHKSGETDTISPISSSVAARVMNERTAFLSGDAVNDERFEEMNGSIFEQQVRSVMCAPLMGPSHLPVGVIHVETSDVQRVFTQADLDVLVSVALLAGQAVDYASMHRSLLDLDRQRRDLAMAREVQLHFLPSRRPEVPGYRFYDFYKAAEEVAGDYYDYIELPDGRQAMVVGDVAGKGVTAALLMARLCSDVRYALLTAPSPAEAMRRLNEQLGNHGSDGAFVTMVLCVIDPRDHSLVIVNAGHCPPILRRKNSPEVVDLDPDGAGLPLGVNRAAHYDQFTMTLEPGDLVVCFTDGVNEAMNPSEQIYGMEAVREVIARSPHDVMYLSKALMADVRRFAEGRLQSDDICLLTFARVQDEPPSSVHE